MDVSREIRQMGIRKFRLISEEEARLYSSVWGKDLEGFQIEVVREAFDNVGRGPIEWPNVHHIGVECLAVMDKQKAKQKSIEYYGCDIDAFPKCYWDEMKKVEKWGNIDRYEQYGDGELREATYLAWKNKELFRGDTTADDFKAIAKYEKNVSVIHG